MSTHMPLSTLHCSHTTIAATDAECADYLVQLPNWCLQEYRLVKKVTFKNYYETLAFINAMAFIVHQEDHHPDITFGYNHCDIAFHTHSVNNGQGGLSINDFICAAKIDALMPTIV